MQQQQQLTVLRAMINTSYSQYLQTFIFFLFVKYYYYVVLDNNQIK